MNLDAIQALFLLLADSMPPDPPESASIDLLPLIRRAQSGERDAVAALYQLHVSRIHRYIAIRIDSAQDVEDLTAEVFVRMVEGLKAYQITGAPFESWLYRIAASRVADHYRRRKRRPQVDLSETMTDDEPHPEEQIVQGQSLAQLRAALAQLPDEQQTILILRFVERRSHEEVAQYLGKSVTAIKSAQHRALIQLTALLGTERKARHYLRGES